MSGLRVWVMAALVCLVNRELAAAPPRAALPAAAAPTSSAPPAQIPAEIQDFMRLLSGVHDTAVQIILDDRALGAATNDVSRLRTVIEPVDLPWLGPSVLYLEETLHDVPATPRRQVLLRLSIDSQLRPRRIRVRQYTIRNPQQWRGLFDDRQAQAALRRADLASQPGCDLLLTRDGDQFRGGTLGRGCITPGVHPDRYVDYGLQVGTGVYWFRTRQFRFADDALVQESAGYDWQSLHLAQLYSCQIRFSASGRAADLTPVSTLRVADHGGHADITLPDGRAIRLTLHSDDWPSDASGRALMLILEERTPGGASARGWNDAEALTVSASLQVMDARCVPMAPRASPPLAAAWH